MKITSPKENLYENPAGLAGKWNAAYSFYEQLKFCAQLSRAWKMFYNLEAILLPNFKYALLLLESQSKLNICLLLQCSKLLADVNVIQFYPSKFVLVTDILDTFGKLYFCCLLLICLCFFGSLYCKHYGPRSDCSLHFVCFFKKSSLKCPWIYAANVKADNIFSQ